MRTEKEIREIVLAAAGTEKYSTVAKRIERLFSEEIRNGKNLCVNRTSDFHWAGRENRTAEEQQAEIIACSGNRGSGFNSYYTYVWVTEEEK